MRLDYHGYIGRTWLHWRINKFENTYTYVEITKYIFHTDPIIG